MTEENPHAGQGPVILDIGGDIGALIVEMPWQMDGLEVEIIPTGTDARPAEAPSGGLPEHGHSGRSHDEHSHNGHSHDGQGHDGHGHDGHHHVAHDHNGHDHDSHDHHSHDHHSHDGDGGPPSPPHVAVVARPTPTGTVVHSLVYGELVEGTYDLYVRPHGPVRLTATVVGGEVTQTRWPDWPSAN